MTIDTIRTFINSEVIFKRGVDYYRQDRVSIFDRGGNVINALVNGNAYKPYTVQVRLNEAGNPKTAFCNCPHAGGIRNCKHIAAVLMEEYAEKTPPSNPIEPEGDRSPGSDINEEIVINLRDGQKKSRQGFDFVNHLVRATGLPKDSSVSKRYKLVFIIENIDNYPSSGWMIYPSARYIKASGEPGRFDRYREEWITEAFGKVEKMLLYRLSRREGHMDILNSHMDFLIDHMPSPLFVKHNRSIMPASFIEISSIHVSFAVHSIKKEQVYFVPEIVFTGEKQRFVLQKDSGNRFVSSGFSVFIIGDDGGIFFSRDNEPAVDLLDLLLYKKRSYIYGEIKRLSSFFTGGRGGIRIEKIPGELRIKPFVPKPFIEIAQKHNWVFIELWFQYGSVDLPELSDMEFIPAEDEGTEYAVYRRNYEFEKEVYQFFTKKFKTHFQQDYYFRVFRVPVDQTTFLLTYGKALLDEGIEIRLKGKKKKITTLTGAIALRVSPELDWFDVKVGYQDSAGNMKDIEFDPSLLSEGLVKAGDQYIIVTEKDIAKLEVLFNEGMNKTGELKVSKFRFHFIDDFYNDIVNNHDAGIERIRKISAQLKSFKKMKKHALPRGFHGILRDYQNGGYNWLFFLNEYGLGGCLADDMGLGKTVQALAFFQKLKEEGRLKTSLVVVPVNTIANWESEIYRFTPELDYLLYYGPARAEMLEDIDANDFILTSYQTLRNDIALLKEITFNYVLLDESQNIKNFNSLLFKAVRVLQSEHRMSLTGTPIENSIFELWSQMEFLNPGMLGGRRAFMRSFVRPIEKQKNSEAAEHLRKIIYPFILRRKKEDVVKELPDKSEAVLYSQMEERQSEIYEQHKEFYRKAIAGKIERDGIEKSAIEILAALLKLRQIALFPVLADRKFRHVRSCKFRQMKDIVEEILQENHKIVIFSQFVQCLGIIREYVDKSGFKHSYIDGSVKSGQRKKEIQKFQEREEYRLFLLSLKAGGVGINLTAADYVILFDPWWNPAVESQAVDRVHRIGQTKKVIAYKMVTKGTVEEKMLILQERKKELANELITTETGFFKSLTKEDVIGMFEG